ncbi:hypothetical protein [Actinoplanes sp. NPDC026670]
MDQQHPGATEDQRVQRPGHGMGDVSGGLMGDREDEEEPPEGEPPVAGPA